MDFGLGLFIGMFIMWVIAMKLKAEWKRDLEKLKDYETLEEAAERYVHGGIYLNEPEKQQTEIAFYEGAKLFNDAHDPNIQKARYAGGPDPAQFQLKYPDRTTLSGLFVENGPLTIADVQIS